MITKPLPKVAPMPCSKCSKPFAEIHKSADGKVRLLVRSRHNGEFHQNVLTLEDLKQMLDEFEAQSQDRDRHNS